MRILSVPVTIVRVPLELGFGAAKEAVKFAHGLVARGEEQVEEKPRPAPPPRRRRTSSRAGAKSGNGRAGTGAAKRRPSRRPAEEAMKAAPPIDEPASAAAAAPTPPSEDAAPVEPAAAGPEPVAAAAGEPAHIDDEPELVAETAESGAEDGAGAEVDVDQPWPGYDEMTAPDIEDRLQAEGPEAAAAVSLYEASHKGRASILEAASRTMIT
jgi:hypothetical protein